MTLGSTSLRATLCSYPFKTSILFVVIYTEGHRQQADPGSTGSLGVEPKQQCLVQAGLLSTAQHALHLAKLRLAHDCGCCSRHIPTTSWPLQDYRIE